MSRLRILTSDRVFSRNTGGNTTYAKNLYDGLAALGHEHVVSGPPAALLRRARGATYALWDGFAVPARSRRYDVDLVHFPSDTGGLVRSAAPIVATIHGVASHHVEGVRTARQESLWRLRVRRLAAVSDAVVTVSESSARDLTAALGCDPGKIHVIPHGLDHETFRPLSAIEAGERLAEARLPGRYVLYYGNIEPRKNIPALLAAIGDRRLRDADVELVIAGRPAWNAEPLMRAIREAPRTTYLGGVPLPWLPALLARAQAFVFPSLYEGFGFPVLEALACGTPVVTTRAGAIPEVAGDAAAYADVSRRGALAAALQEVVGSSSIQADLRERGLVRAARFRWQTSVEAHAALFAAVASRARKVKQ